MVSASEGFCSPSHEKVYEKSGTCFSKPALVRLAEAWNKTHSSADGKDIITNVQKLSSKQLWDALNNRMSKLCGAKNETCWVDKLSINHAPEVAGSLSPKRPSEWTQNPYTWLTNFDIADVMNQYDVSVDPTFKYRFLGVYPIDFQSSMFGQCLFSEICALRIVPLYKKGVRFLGLITNLDRHDQDGSHWTSLFVGLDPKLPSFGAWYYDSAGNDEPKEIKQFKQSLEKQVQEAADIFHGAKFVIDGEQQVPYRHQYKNTECGMFSIDYQLRWLKSLQKKPKTTFKDIVDIPLRDDDVHALRYKYFRPTAGGGLKAKKRRTRKRS